MPKLLWLLAMIVLCSSSTCMSADKVDSLKIVLENTSEGAAKIDVLIQLSSEYRNQNPDSMKWYADQALSMTDGGTSSADIVKILNLIGIFHFRKASYDSAIYYFERGLPNAQLAGDSVQYAAFFNNIGLCYTYLSEFDKAVDYHLQALAIREAIGDSKISSTYNNLGIVYDRMNDLEKAEEYQLKALALKRKEGQTLALSNSLLNLGIIKRKQEKFKDAITYYEQALTIAEEFGDKKKMANAYNNIGSAYVSLQNFRTAATYFDKSVVLKREIEDLQGLARTLGELAEIKAHYGDFASARSLMLEAEGIAAKIGAAEIEQLVYTNRADIEEMAGNYKSALAYEKKASAVWNEIISKEKNERIAELEVIFENTRKEAEIKSLALQSKINEAETAQARAWLIATAISMSMVIITLGILFVMYRKKQKTELALQEQQMDALKKRYMDLLEGPAANDLSVNINSLNQKLVEQLSEREFEAFQLSLAGKTNQEIADQLYISTHTVKYHLRNVYNKLGVRNRKEAVEYVVYSS